MEFPSERASKGLDHELSVTKTQEQGHLLVLNR